jgi:hypothetical protein
LVKIADVLNRLQKFVKEGRRAEGQLPHPVCLAFHPDGMVSVAYSDATNRAFPTLGKAAQAIHQRLDEIDKQTF